MLQELGSADAVHAFLRQHPNALVTFSAHWCGPCRASKPALEDMASRYHRDVTKNVKFGIVYENDLGESIHQYRIRAFPTYVLFVQAAEYQRVEGANLEAIRQMIERAGCHAVLTGGVTLGTADTSSSSSGKLSPEEARALRLAKLGTTATPPAANATTPEDTLPAPATTQEDVDMKDSEKAAKSTEDAVDAAEAAAAPAEAKDPVAQLNPEALSTLTETMGFSLLRAQKGLLYGKSGTVEDAVEWLLEHQEDDDIDDPITDVSNANNAVPQSYKCNECGKILSNMANLELHANKTGHSDFEESTERVKPLTVEEKAAKVAEIKELLKAKRAERENMEKEDQKEREKQRRFMGKEMAKTREQLEHEQRLRDAMLRKKEKENERRERERIRAELAKDKAERQANKGKLSSKLGVEGYHPDAIQYDSTTPSAPRDAAVPTPAPASKSNASKIDEYIQRVSSYRAGGDGGKCLKVLLAYVKNVVEQPDEAKFKTINTENNAFKTKVRPFLGAKQLLQAVGFHPSDDGTALVLGDDADTAILAQTKSKLEAALAAFQ